MKGHIKERSPGHWAIVLDAQDANGNRKLKWQLGFYRALN
jgi:hypothetical protein